MTDCRQKEANKLTSFADEYVMLVKGAETAVLDQLASGPRDVTLDHVNEYAEVFIYMYSSSLSPSVLQPHYHHHHHHLQHHRRS